MAGTIGKGCHNPLPWPDRDAEARKRWSERRSGFTVLIPTGRGSAGISRHTWGPFTGCGADGFDDDHEELQACEANPEPRSALGPCAEQDVLNWAKAKG